MLVSFQAFALDRSNTTPPTYYGTSSETKPTVGIPPGARFVETDTNTTYVFSNAAWATLYEGVYLGSLLAGEDQTNDVLKTEQQFSYCAGIVADGSCKASAGFLHTVTCASDDAAATAGSVAIRDATSAGTGTIIQNINFAAAFFPPVTMTFDVVFSTGLYLDFTTTADVECSASYR